MQRPEVFVQNLEIKEQSKKIELIHMAELCYNCGHQLSFEHQTDWLSCQVFESVSCPHCMGQVPQRVFSLS